MMTERTRSLMFKAMDGNMNLIPLMEYFYDYRRVDMILDWLIKNRMTGKTLEDWVTKKWGMARFDMVKFILMRIDKLSVCKPIFLGEEYTPRR